MLCMDHDEATEGFAFNIEAMSFIECLGEFIDFENLQFHTLGLLASRGDNRCKKFGPDPFLLVVWMNNDHPYEYLPVLIFDVGIPD